jgi:signal transduction histidine kinase
MPLSAQEARWQQSIEEVDLINKDARWAIFDSLLLDFGDAQAKTAWAMANKLNYTRGKAESVYTMALIKQRKNDPEGAISDFLEAASLFQKENAMAEVAYLHLTLGNLYLGMQAYTKASEYFDRAYGAFMQLQNTKAAQDALNQAAEASVLAGNWESVLTYYSRLHHSYVLEGQGRAQLFTLKKMAEAYHFMGMHQHGLQQAQQLLALARSLGDSVEVAHALNNMGFALTHSKQYQEAIPLYVQAYLLDVQLHGEQRINPATLINLGIGYQQIGKYSDAIFHLLKARERLLRMGNKRKAMEVSDMLANTYFLKKDYYNARKACEESIELANQLKDPGLLKNAYLTYSKIMQLSNNLETAFEYFKQHLTYRDSIFQQEKQQQQRLAELQYRMERKDQEMRLRLVDEERKDLELRRQQLENESLEKQLELLRNEQSILAFIQRQAQLEQEKALQAQVLARQQLEAEKNEREIRFLLIQDSIQGLKIKEKDLARVNDLRTIELLEREREVKQLQLDRIQEARKWGLAIIGLFLIIFILIVIGFVNTRKINLKLARQKEEIEQKNEEISSQRDTLASSYQELESAHSKLKMAQSQLIESEKMASLGQLTAGIAHEINNPINFVSANISPLRRDIDDLLEVMAQVSELRGQQDLPPRVQEVLKQCEALDVPFLLEEIHALLKGIEEGAARTKDIVLGLRNFSRLDEHDFKMADLHEGINSTLTILKSKMKDRITVHTHFGDIPKIECLPGQLNQVFVNIVGNACQAIQGKGELTITTQDLGEVVSVSFWDTGIGMDPETMNRIFEPFFTTKEVGEGTGLGLAIAYGIIEQHKGQIQVSSQPGAGSEFVLLLPKQQAPGNGKQEKLQVVKMTV